MNIYDWVVSGDVIGSADSVNGGDNSAPAITLPINLKDYENVALRHDPVYYNVEEIIEVLKAYIKEAGLIIYGGLAIDYALRLKGDKLYPDDLLQVDYDFYSPNNIVDSYTLAEAFLGVVTKQVGTEAAEGVRAIGGMHFKTMRVDIRDNHFIADITYVPPSLFKLLPTLEHEGIKIIHPDFQRLDIHHALSFPYDYPPTEVITNRWKKDLTRFQLLEKYYPVGEGGVNGGEGGVNGGRSKPDTITPRAYPKYVLAGFTGYQFICAELTRIHGDKITELMVHCASQVLEIVHNNPSKAIEELKLTHVRRYVPTIGLFPDIVYGMSADGPVRIYSTEDSLVSVVSVNVDNTHQRVAAAQYLAHGFLAHYHLAKMHARAKIGSGSGKGNMTNTTQKYYSADAAADVYLQHYISLMNIIEYEDKLSIPRDEKLTRLSIDVYGSANISSTKKIQLARIAADQGKGNVPNIPQNYYPARSRANGRPRPVYDIEASGLFREDGAATE
jgi:hypothetical protein